MHPSCSTSCTWQVLLTIDRDTATSAPDMSVRWIGCMENREHFAGYLCLITALCRFVHRRFSQSSPHREPSSPPHPSLTQLIFECPHGMWPCQDAHYSMAVHDNPCLLDVVDEEWRHDKPTRDGQLRTFKNDRLLLSLFPSPIPHHVLQKCCSSIWDMHQPVRCSRPMVLC